MDIQLIVTDLDGTLVMPSSDVLTPRTEAAMQAAYARGVYLVPATGRSLERLPEWVFDHPCIRYACTSNGARITDVKTGQTRRLTPLPQQTVFDVLAILAPYATQGGVYSCGMSLREDRRGPRGARHLDGPGLIKTDMATFLRHRPEMLAEKVDYYFESPEEMGEALEQLKRIPGITLGSAFDTNIEINAVGADKGGALCQLSELLHIDRQQMMALGDGLNDLSMFRTAGLGVAMGNATEALKQAAQAITARCEDDGAAQAIERYVLGG